MKCILKEKTDKQVAVIEVDKATDFIEQIVNGEIRRYRYSHTIPHHVYTRIRRKRVLKGKK